MVPYYIRDPKRDHIFDNHPYLYTHFSWVLLTYCLNLFLQNNPKPMFWLSRPLWYYCWSRSYETVCSKIQSSTLRALSTTHRLTQPYYLEFRKAVMKTIPSPCKTCRREPGSGIWSAVMTWRTKVPTAGPKPQALPALSKFSSTQLWMISCSCRVVLFWEFSLRERCYRSRQLCHHTFRTESPKQLSSLCVLIFFERCSMY